ncbi:hypothetical protein KVH27_35065 [Streptomyces olivaceus]|uniref:hypothetical protein n=1 Tax=Streptomyces olivaceus TaxID=47716 RepID=UPI001CCA640C|nr:hypothetical protein [Streptomyces olivaceus]MBZ6253573.1 hypothetical protein [Streptomyces olivaceus]
MPEDFAAGGRVPTEQWTSLRLLGPLASLEPNPHPMPDDLDQWVAPFVAAAGSPFRMRPAPAAVRILLQRYAQNDDFPEAWRLPAPLKGTS